MPRFAISPLGLTTEGSTKFKPKGWKRYLKKLQCIITKRFVEATSSSFRRWFFSLHLGGDWLNFLRPYHDWCSAHLFEIKKKVEASRDPFADVNWRCSVKEGILVAVTWLRYLRQRVARSVCAPPNYFVHLCSRRHRISQAWILRGPFLHMSRRVQRPNPFFFKVTMTAQNMEGNRLSTQGNNDNEIVQDYSCRR